MRHQCRPLQTLVAPALAPRDRAEHRTNRAGLAFAAAAAAGAAATSALAATAHCDAASERLDDLEAINMAVDGELKAFRSNAAGKELPVVSASESTEGNVQLSFTLPPEGAILAFENARQRYGAWGGSRGRGGRGSTFFSSSSSSSPSSSSTLGQSSSSELRCDCPGGRTLVVKTEGESAELTILVPGPALRVDVEAVAAAYKAAWSAPPQHARLPGLWGGGGLQRDRRGLGDGGDDPMALFDEAFEEMERAFAGALFGFGGRGNGHGYGDGHGSEDGISRQRRLHRHEPWSERRLQHRDGRARDIDAPAASAAADAAEAAQSHVRRTVAELERLGASVHGLSSIRGSGKTSGIRQHSWEDLAG